MKTLGLNEKEIDRAVRRAIARIPSEIRHHLKNVVISVQKRPSREILEEMGLHRNEPLLGMYILFQESLERMCNTIDELEEQIEITVVHEIAHFLGISEERLAELGYG
jgi:predicted Zn-dependent protease with MMP-like domain